MMKALWHHHPAVRSGDKLSLGERAADKLKSGFGSWPFLFILNGIIVVWITANVLLRKAFDPFPFILLNLGLSWLAAQQGGALQIASNRGDRISSELALDTHNTTKLLMQINEQQLEILRQLAELRKAESDG